MRFLVLLSFGFCKRWGLLDIFEITIIAVYEIQTHFYKLGMHIYLRRRKCCSEPGIFSYIRGCFTLCPQRQNIVCTLLILKYLLETKTRNGYLT
uniref:Uncharacterized protein n=1 Tax=Lepeophtheirus salmonis TaxID=72036 RepID=A0A0K2TML3_LEPSM